MKIELGNTGYEVRVKKGGWPIKVFLAAYALNHRNGKMDNFKHQVQVFGESEKAMQQAFNELKEWCIRDSESPVTHINPQRSKRGFVGMVEHFLDFRAGK